MPPEKETPGSPINWIRYAESDLNIAKVPLPERVMLETLCYHTQQCAEKSLKALLISYGKPFSKTHNIRTLLDQIQKEINIPDDIQISAILTDYSVESRYPGDVEPVTKKEYREAVKIAEDTYNWALGLLKTRHKN
jgi:HEPN domain-containing protein